MQERVPLSQESMGSKTSEKPDDIDWGKLTEKVMKFRKIVDKLEKKETLESCKCICMNKWQCVCIYIFRYSNDKCCMRDYPLLYRRLAPSHLFSSWHRKGHITFLVVTSQGKRYHQYMHEKLFVFTFYVSLVLRALLRAAEPHIGFQGSWSWLIWADLSRWDHQSQST